MSKRTLAILSFLMIVSVASFGQSYDKAIGLRAGGWNASLTYKQRLGEAYIEGILGTGSYQNGGFSVAALYELGYLIPQNVLPSKLNWYFGGGGFFTSVSNFSSIGIVGVLGLDYTLKNAPLNITLDYMPAMTLVSEAGRGYGHGGGLGIRYTF